MFRVQGLGLNGQTVRGLAGQVFQAQNVASVTPDAVGYVAAITSCEKGALWQEALQCFEQQQRLSPPNAISFNATISACGKASQWQAGEGKPGGSAAKAKAPKP